MFDFLSIIKDLLFLAGYLSGKTFPKPLSKEDEAKYLKASTQGDEAARHKLVEHNLRLVAHIVKKYQNTALSSDDLISIGTIGLIKAVNSFLPPKKGTQLATYAAKCIENEVLMALRSSKKIKCEVSLSDPIGVDKEGKEISLIDILGTREDLVAEQAALAIQTGKLYGLLGKYLTRREKAVIEMRYGLAECARKRSVRSHIRRVYRAPMYRIERKAIAKLAAELSKNSGL
jgi:RNA polymerase sporulation-specific sigma factor